MRASAAGIVAEFEAAARMAKQSEEEVRKKLAAEIAGIERKRQFAFRRANLVRTLAVAAVREETEDAAHSAQRQAVCAELGWGEPSEAQSSILQRMAPLTQAVWQCTRDDAADRQAIRFELEAFEAWFEGSHGRSFYALFDQYVPEVPVVDF